MKKSFFIYSLLYMCLFLFGCDYSVIEEPEPLLPPNPNYRKKYIDQDYTKAEIEHNNSCSRESAELAWEDLYNNNLSEAMRMFNMAWGFNHKNYLAYWGFGIIRGIQAEKTSDSETVEKYLKQSIDFLEQAMELAPDNIKNKIQLDLANAETGMGAYYLLIKKPDKADIWLKKSEKIIDNVLIAEKENGRAYFLLSASLFYQGSINPEKLKQARLNAKKAEKYGFKLSPEYNKDLFPEMIK